MPNITINTGNTLGITRKIDELGRVVIPMEYRNKLGLKEKDPVEIYLLKNGIYIGKTDKKENL